MQRLDSSDSRTFGIRWQALTRKLVSLDLPYALAKSYAGDEVLKRYVFTRRVTSLALAMSESGLRSFVQTQMSDSGDTPEAGGNPLSRLMDARASLTRSMNSLSSQTLSSGQVSTRRQRREQDREIKKFLQNLKKHQMSPEVALLQKALQDG